VNIIADIVLGMIRLIAAEMGSLRKAMLRLAWSFAFAVLAALFLFVGTGALLWTAYQYLVPLLGPSGGGLFIAVLSFLLAALAGKLAQMHAR
jgi:hypothetical protein